MVPLPRFDLAQTTSARPLWGGGQAQQKLNSEKALGKEAEREENPAQWKWQEDHRTGNQDNKNKVSRKLTRLSLLFQSSGWGRKSSFLQLEGHMADKILIPLQSLICCFLKPPANKWAAVGALGCPEASTIWGVLVAVAQASRGSSVFNLLCAKDQTNENCGHRSGYLAYFPAGYEGDCSACFSHCFFLQSFSSSLLAKTLSA